MSRVAVVVDRYPALSESFIRGEIARLRAHGFDVAVVTCSPVDRCDTLPAPDPAVPVLRPSHVWRGPPTSLRAASIAAATRERLAAWRPDWLHAHFLGIPSRVAARLADALRVPFSISAHARDVFVPPRDIEALSSRARFIAACSALAHDVLRSRLPLQTSVELFPHTVACANRLPERTSAHDAPIRLLSVCRLVPKKGVDHVLRALARLPRGVQVRYRIIGDGPERARLQRLAERLGVVAEFLGAQPPDAVATELAQSDLFLLGSTTASDGDRDGIPNAILEAMAAGVPVIAGHGGAVAEAIEHRRTGWLVPSADSAAFAAAIQESIANDALRRSVVASAHAEVRSRFADDLPFALGERLMGELQRQARSK